MQGLNPRYPVFGQQEKMAQMQRQRHAEATKEMLFRVYGNVIATLEEFEQRRTTERMTASEIDFPDQSWKSFEDVKDNVEVQLALFERHRKSGLADITEEVNDELRKKTIIWAAARGERSLDETDKYIAQLYEILVKGTTHHKVFDEPSQPVAHSTMGEALPQIMKGQAEAMEIDSSYKRNPEKKAIGPSTRKSKQPDKIGARRIYSINKRLQQYLENDVPGFMDLR